MSYRHILESVRARVPVRRYWLAHSIEADIPDSLALRLPLFGDINGEETYLNSGGRGILLEHEGEVYRLKGIDPMGTLVRLVADSDENLIYDIRGSAEVAPDPESMLGVLMTGENITFPTYTDKPYNFLTQEAVRNSRRAFDVIGEEYQRYDFSHPCRFGGFIAYDHLRWREKPLNTIIFRLTNMRSDLRDQELGAKLRIHLQYASPDQLREVADQFINFYKGLLRWYAFECGILAQKRLVPTEASMLGQNHVIGNVSPGKIGLVRVYHTSTRKMRLNRRRLDQRITYYKDLLITFMSHILLALEMADRSFKYDGDRFSNYYDAAFKLGPIEGYHWPLTVSFLREMEGEFQASYRSGEPEPVDESELVELYDVISSIEIDWEHEAEKKRQSEMFSNRLWELGLTMDDWLIYLQREGLI